jgi:hypothetical protein
MSVATRTLIALSLLFALAGLCLTGCGGGEEPVDSQGGDAGDNGEAGGTSDDGAPDDDGGVTQASRDDLVGVWVADLDRMRTMGRMILETQAEAAGETLTDEQFNMLMQQMEAASGGMQNTFNADGSAEIMINGQPLSATWNVLESGADWLRVEMSTTVPPQTPDGEPRMVTTLSTVYIDGTDSIRSKTEGEASTGPWVDGVPMKRKK